MPFIERRYVFTGNYVFVYKTNVGQHAGSGVAPYKRVEFVRGDPAGSSP